MVKVLALEDALIFLAKVKQRFGGGIEYKSFKHILKRFKQDYNMTSDQLLVEVAYLFRGHPDLFEDFTQFLPDDVANQLRAEGNMQQMPKIRARL